MWVSGKDETVLEVDSGDCHLLRSILKSTGLYNSKFNYVICDFLQIKLYLVKWRHFIQTHFTLG